VSGFAWQKSGGGGSGGRADPRCRSHILLRQERREGEDVADVVEAVADVVRRGFLISVEIDADEIANGVAVFNAVEAAQSHAARVRILRVDTKRTVLDPAI